MSNLEKIPALRIDGAEVSLQTVLQTLVVAGKQRFLETAAEEIVIAQAAKEMGIAISDEQLQVAADSYRRERRLSDAEATHKFLEREGWSVDDFTQHLERGLIRREIVERIATPEKTAAHFSQHRRANDHAKLAHIVVKKETLAQELLAQIEDDGADFAALAGQHSTDARTASVGGELGLTERTALQPAAEQKVFGAQPGDVVGPFVVGNSFQLIRVHELTLGKLDKNVNQAIRFDLFSQWVEKQMQAANVDFTLFNSHG